MSRDTTNDLAYLGAMAGLIAVASWTALAWGAVAWWRDLMENGGAFDD
jgi:uncharacterized membrane protein